MRFQSQRGVALVITLVMLAMVTTMAVVFLSISRRERASVTVISDQTTAQLMADHGLAQAQAAVISRLVGTGNDLAYGFSVSTNYINPLGFNPALGINPTNVAYHYGNGKPLTKDHLLESLANLNLSPRPPVFVDVSQVGFRPEHIPPKLDFRHYVDFNRNRHYEPTGWLIETNWQGQPIMAAPNVPLTNHFVGDPDWVGLLEDPSLAHGPTNRFVGRYAYMVLPTGRSLDINYIHNEAREPMNPRVEMPPGSSGRYLYNRNQGVGSWELNLAAFLRELHPTQWQYFYDWIHRPVNVNRPQLPRAEYLSFSDARDILLHRYNDTRRNLPSIMASLGLPQVPANYLRFQANMIDDYSDGPLLLAREPLFDHEDRIRVDPYIAPWPGSDNPTKFTDVQQLLTFQTFIEAPYSPDNFVSKLRQAMEVRPRNWRSRQHLSSQDRYTFYRLLAQMGVDSGPALRGKINLNHANDWTSGHNLRDRFGNVNWTASNFVNRAAHAMLRASVKRQGSNYFIGATRVHPQIGLGDTNTVHPHYPKLPVGIQIYPTNEYSAEVHRLVQLAANIYDSTTNRLEAGPPYLPSVLRPVFRKRLDIWGRPVVFISGYTEVTNASLTLSRRNWVDLTNVVSGTGYPADGTDLRVRGNQLVNIHGVPWVVGAKKGLPNFNEYSVESVVQVSRRLEVNKGVAANIDPIHNARWKTNQMYTLGITNLFGVEGWNAYSNSYPRPLYLEIRHHYEIGLWDFSRGAPTNVAYIAPRTPYRLTSKYPASTWGGGTYKIPLRQVVTAATNSIYSTHLRKLFPNRGQMTKVFEQGFNVPDWKLFVTNRLQYFLVDTALNRVVDVVNLDNFVTSLDIARLMTGQTNTASSMFSSAAISEGAFWNTNRVNPRQASASATAGMISQMQVSQGNTPVNESFWRNYNNDRWAGWNKQKSIQDFKDFLLGQNRPRVPSDLIRKQAPFTPTRKLYKSTSWQANDPLVHYTVNDLSDRIITDPQGTNNVAYIRPPNALIPNSNLGLPNERYRPWGGGQLRDVNDFNSAVKDPLITSPENWLFPANKYASIGWLGRVHRGSPWQTVYLKSRIANATNWWAWSGSFDTHPTNDWKLLQLFTAAANENAARGLLSVNQTNAAAWSAVLSGVSVLSNSLPDAPTLPTLVATAGALYEPHLIQPNSPQMDWIMHGTRGQKSVYQFNPWTQQSEPMAIPGLHQTRMAKNGFRTLGDFLATPTLTAFSPFVNPGHVQLATTGIPTDQQKYALHENIIEWLPQQILGLLKEDEPRVTVYAFGQSLKPAEQSIVTAPGHYYGMCTNYQITGEVFSKTTFLLERQWEGDNLTYKAVVEDYQILPEE